MIVILTSNKKKKNDFFWKFSCNCWISYFKCKAYKLKSILCLFRDIIVPWYYNYSMFASVTNKSLRRVKDKPTILLFGIQCVIYFTKYLTDLVSFLEKIVLLTLCKVVWTDGIIPLQHGVGRLCRLHHCSEFLIFYQITISNQLL